MADSHSKPKEAKSYATQPKTKMAFDMGKPLKCGFLKKKGDKIKLVKERFFVLYPNFLVYYADATKWQFDKTVGRLESRKGAFKLTGARASVPAKASEIADVKFPFFVSAPDINNKKTDILLDASSGEECKSWIDAINNASEAAKK